MSGPKHTPGPWRACKDGACVCGHIWAEGDKRVATVHENTRDGDGTVHAEWSREERVANARLIAAAPRLAAALERCADALDSFACDPPGLPSVEWTEEDAEAVREANAALREAGVS